MHQKELIIRNSLFSESSEHFEEGLNKYNLQFLSPLLEKEYLNSRINLNFKQKIFEIIMIITMILVNGRVCIRASLTLFYKNPLEIDRIYLIFIIILMVIATSLELIVFLFQYFWKLRGIFMCTIPYFAYILLSYQFDLKTKKEPYLAPPIIALMLLIMSSANLYTYNLLISIFCLSVDYIGMLWFLSMLLYEQVYENIVNYLLYTSAFVLAGYSLYVKEFERRNIFYTKHLLQQNKNNLKRILQGFPDPIIGCRNGSICFVNEKFYSLKQNEEVMQNESISGNGIIQNSGRLVLQTTENRNSNHILEKIINVKNNPPISLAKVVKEEKSIISEQLFHLKYEGKKKIPINISSINLKDVENNIRIYILRNVSNLLNIHKSKVKESSMRSFLATVSHDFKNPLTSISSVIDELLNRFNFNEEIILELRSCQDLSNFLLVLVQDILDYAQFKSKSIRITPIRFDFHHIFITTCTCISRVFVREKSKGHIAFSCTYSENIPQFLFSDENRIKQVLFNLISNAYKFTQQGKIEIKASYEEEKEEEKKIITITVSDTGMGIKNEDIDKLFHDFTKLEDPLKLNPQGVGLGLSICSKISKLLDGNIEVFSEYGVGSTFIFKFNPFLTRSVDYNRDNQIEGQKISNIEEEKVIPAIRKASIQEFDFYIEGKLKKNCNCTSILIVDDDTSQRKPIVNYCKKHQILYDEAENGQIAVEKVEAKLNSICCKVYTIIFTDSNMPILGGVEASLKIRDLENKYLTKHSRIIGLSGNISDFDSAIDNTSKFNLFWKIYPKPFKFSEFQNIISLVFR